MHKISQYIYDICKTHIEFYDIKHLSWQSLDSTVPMWNQENSKYKIGLVAFVLGESYKIDVEVYSPESFRIERYLYRAMYEIEQKYGIKCCVSKEDMIKSVGLDDPFKLFLDQT